MRRFHYSTKADVWRHGYTGNKSSIQNTNISYYGFFQPIDSDANTVALGIVSQAYQFVTEGTADIKPSDKLVIDSVDYRVRGVKRNTMKRNDFLTAIMELSIKA